MAKNSESETAQDAIDARTALSADAPGAVMPDAPAVLPHPALAIVDAWVAKHIPGMGAHLTEYLHGRLLAAIDDLKDLLLELPIS